MLSEPVVVLMETPEGTHRPMVCILCGCACTLEGNTTAHLIVVKWYKRTILHVAPQVLSNLTESLQAPAPNRYLQVCIG